MRDVDLLKIACYKQNGSSNVETNNMSQVELSTFIGTVCNMLESQKHMMEHEDLT